MEPTGLINNYSMSERWLCDGRGQRGAQRRVDYNCLISNEREWNNCFIKKAPKISRILHDFICKTADFQLVFSFEQTRTVTIFGEYGIINNHSSSPNGL